MLVVGLDLGKHGHFGGHVVGRRRHNGGVAAAPVALGVQIHKRLARRLNVLQENAVLVECNGHVELLDENVALADHGAGRVVTV